MEITLLDTGTSDILDASISKPTHGGPSYSIKHRLLRAIWGVVWALGASWTPPPLHGWRRFLLGLFGAKIHPTARVYGSAHIWYPPNLVLGARSIIGPKVFFYSVARIVVGEQVTISQYSHISPAGHDIDSPTFQLIARPLDIGNFAWVAMGAYLGTSMGEGAVLGARGVALGKSLEAWTVYVGNPAVALRERTNISQA